MDNQTPDLQDPYLKVIAIFDSVHLPAKQREEILAWHHAEIDKARIYPFDFVEPCEPDCSPERHAYHQGQWDMTGRINEHFGLPPYPVAKAKCKFCGATTNVEADGYHAACKKIKQQMAKAD